MLDIRREQILSPQILLIQGFTVNNTVLEPNFSKEASYKTFLTEGARWSPNESTFESGSILLQGLMWNPKHCLWSMQNTSFFSRDCQGSRESTVLRLSRQAVNTVSALPRYRHRRLTFSRAGLDCTSKTAFFCSSFSLGGLQPGSVFFQRTDFQLPGT